MTHSVESGEYEREAKADKENIVVPTIFRILRFFFFNFRIGEQLNIYWNSNNFVFLYVLVNMNLHHLDVNIVIYEDVSISIRMRKGEVSIPDESLLLFLRPLSSSSLLHFQTNSIN